MLLHRLTNKELCTQLQLRADLSPAEQVLLDRLILAMEEVDRLDDELTAAILKNESDAVPA